MEIRAYDELYAGTAQNILGHMVDFAVISLEVEPDALGNAFAVSSVSRQFEIGNPRYVAGMNGCELARLVLSETNMAFIDTEDAMFLDKSPEYWAGWALAYYQWHSSHSFMDILSAIPLSRIIGMYPVYHEMDILQFIDHMDVLIKSAYPSTRLKTLRTNCGLTQSGLASDSGVALRQIQLFEQRQRDINNAAALTLLRLSKSLHCRMEDLMEY
ncbi:MAG: XRE family transcriptional regulator [Lachnospiraceae bacterium]|nr:XRE family transcriptional regulator [Lachnospiraceae bacterium]